MGRIVTKRGQTLGAAFEMRMFRIDVVVVIVGRKHGILAGTDGMMNRVISAAAAQPRQNAVPSAAAAIGVAVRSLRGAGAGQKQAGKDDANEHFGDRLHKAIRYAAKGRKVDSIARQACQPRFRPRVLRSPCIRLIILEYSSADRLLKGRRITFSLVAEMHQFCNMM